MLCMYWSLSTHFPLYPSSLLPPSLLPPPTLPPLSRSDQLVRLRSGKVYDVLVIGGGATGCGIALDSILRGIYIKLVS